MKLRILYFILLGCVAFSCTETDQTDSPEQMAGGKTEAVIGASQLPGTRTSLDPDGRTTRWSDGDRIAVWAHDGSGYTLDAQPFVLRTFNGEYSSADFSATIPQMAEGTYTYCAVYPVPMQRSGTNVTFSLPSAQDGVYNGAADILAAAPITGAALAKQPREELTLAFRHLCHAVRIEIPSGRNLLGEPVKRLEITFPTDVAGDLTFDAADPEAVPVLTNGTNTITIDFAGEGLTDTENTFAWIFIAPTAIEGEIVFRAYNGNGYQAAAIRKEVGKTFEAGHTTPITLTIPKARPVTYLDFKVASNNLGEELTDIHLTAAEELFVAPFCASDAVSASAPAGEGGIFRAAVYADTHSAQQLQNLSLTIGYESENALLQGHSISLPPQIGDESAVNVSMAVPYLMYEDFSEIPSFNEDDNHGSGSHASNPSAVQLNQYGLPGWTGARVGGSANLAVRVCCHYEGAGLTYGRYDGRMDSTPMNGIKEGKSVRVKVSYNYDGGTTQSGKDTAPVYAYGYTTREGGLKGNSDIETQLASGIVLSKTNGYGSINQSNSYEIDGCTAKHRLSWKVSNNRSGWTSYFGDYFLYIDNVRVQIIK